MQRKLMLAVAGGLVLGAVLTFGLVQSEVDAQGTKPIWVCSRSENVKISFLAICKGHGLKCVISESAKGQGLSCVKN